MSFILFITVLITAVLLVVAAFAIAKAIGPRSYNAVKGEPFESGIPTRGSVGSGCQAVWSFGSGEHWFLFGGTCIWPGLRLAERSIGMEVKQPHIKSIPYAEFKDNDTLEQIMNELHEGGVNVVVGSLDQAINWGRSNSLWSLTFATSCCGIEFMSVGCARYDFARFGFEVTRNSPRQADLIMCAGTITNKMAPVMKRLYDEMADPKYVIAVGGCAISGGPFKSSYHVVRGIEEIVPVDVFIPGCPPRPEAILYGMMQLQRKVKVEKFFGGANRKEKKPLVIMDVPKDFDKDKE